MGEEWLKTIIASLIGGLFPLLGVVFTVRSERKRIIFQSLYADKQILYSEIMKGLVQTMNVSSKTNNGKPKGSFFAYYIDLKTHLTKLELIAPRDIIDQTKLLIKLLKKRIYPILPKINPDENKTRKSVKNPRLSLSLPITSKEDPRSSSELDTLDKRIKTQCEKLAELLRKDLGVSKK